MSNPTPNPPALERLTPEERKEAACPELFAFFWAPSDNLDKFKTHLALILATERERTLEDCEKIARQSGGCFCAERIHAARAIEARENRHGG